MQKLIAVLLLSLCASVAWAQAPQTDNDKTFYALGMEIGKSLKVFDMSPAELKFVLMGLQEQIQGKERKELASFQAKIRTIAEARMKKQASKNQETGGAFLKTEAAKPGAKTTKSGLVYFNVKAGTGTQPKATDKVQVHYRGTLIDGTEFDSSYSRNKPAEFPLNRVIPCWTEGVQMMKVGGKSRLVCPAKIAYGDRGTPGIPPSSTLIFEVELLKILPPAIKPAMKLPPNAKKALQLKAAPKVAPKVAPAPAPAK
jgi:FKBP-type peptidyl-prolyl cis-trans isomerase FkpA